MFTNFMDLIKQDRLLPANPTSSDTADWYRLGDATENHGRHMKRQAVAAEYLSGRNMREFARLVGENERTIEGFVLEARRVELLPEVGATLANVGTDVSEALPTQTAALEYAKAEPEVKEIIKYEVELNGKTYTASDIKKLIKDNKDLKDDNDSKAKLVARTTEIVEKASRAMNSADRLAQVTVRRTTQLLDEVVAHQSILTDEHRKDITDTLNQILSTISQ